MTRSRRTAALFLLGALLAGGVIGFTSDRMVSGRHQPPRTDVRAMRDNLARRIGVTAAQRPVVDSILDDRNRQMMELTKPLRAQMDSIRERARTQIRRILTPAQLVEYEALIKESQSDTVRGKK